VARDPRARHSARPRDTRKTESSTRRRGSLKTHRTLWGVVMALMVALFVAACGSSKDDDSGGSSQSASGKDCGKVVLNEQAWAGSTANTYIAKNVLEDKLWRSAENTTI